jgi:hypothetical protein
MTRRLNWARIARIVAVVVAVFLLGQIVAAIPKWTHQGGEGGGDSGIYHSSNVLHAGHLSASRTAVI